MGRIDTAWSARLLLFVLGTEHVLLVPVGEARAVFALQSLVPLGIRRGDPRMGAADLRHVRAVEAAGTGKPSLPMAPTISTHPTKYRDRP